MKELEKLAVSNNGLVDSLKESLQNCRAENHTDLVSALRDIRNLTVGSPKQKKAMHILDVTEFLVHGLVAFRLNEDINNESVRQMKERESVWTEAVSVLISLLNATDQQGPLLTKCYVLKEKLSEGRGEPLEQLAHQLMQLILQQYQRLKHANKVKTEEMDSDMEAPKYNVQLVSVLTKCVCRLLQNGLILPKVIVNQDGSDGIQSSMAECNILNHYMAGLCDLLLLSSGNTMNTADNEVAVNILSVLSSICDDMKATNLSSASSSSPLPNKLESKRDRNLRQNLVCSYNCVVKCIPMLLSSQKRTVFDSALRFVRSATEENPQTSQLFVKQINTMDLEDIRDDVEGEVEGRESSCVSIICNQLRWDRSRDSQLLCCKVLISLLHSKALQQQWPKFAYKVLPTLVRLSKTDCSLKQRTVAAQLIHGLIRNSVCLQRSALNTDHLLLLMVSPLDNTEKDEIPCEDADGDAYNMPNGSGKWSSKKEEQIELRESSLKVLASLCANDPETAARLVNEFNIVERVILPCLLRTDARIDLNSCENQIERRRSEARLLSSCLLLLLSLTRAVPVLVKHLLILRRPQKPSQLPSQSQLLIESSGTTHRGFYRTSATITPLSVNRESGLEINEDESELGEGRERLGVRAFFVHSQPAEQLNRHQSSSIYTLLLQILKTNCVSECSHGSASDWGYDLAVKQLASSILCNLSLPYACSRTATSAVNNSPFRSAALSSPRKALLENGLLKACWQLVSSNDYNLRLNGVWILMNLSCEGTQEDKEQQGKHLMLQIWQGLLMTSPITNTESNHASPASVLSHLLRDPCPHVAEKTSGLLLNLSCHLSRHTCKGDQCVNDSARLVIEKGREIVQFICDGLERTELRHNLLLALWKFSCAPDMCPHLMVEMIVKCDELMQKAKKILLLEKIEMRLVSLVLQWIAKCLSPTDINSAYNTSDNRSPTGLADHTSRSSAISDQDERNRRKERMVAHFRRHDFLSALSSLLGTVSIFAEKGYKHHYAVSIIQQIHHLCGVLRV